MLEKYIRQLNTKGETYLRIKVRPSAARTAIKDVLEDETVKIDIAAPPVKGKANSELIRFLSQEFKVKKSDVKILSGAGEKTKLIKIIDVNKQ